MKAISFALVLLAIFLPLFDGTPVGELEEQEILKMWRLGDLSSLCDFFCEPSTTTKSSARSLTEKSGINPRIFCDLCDDDTTTMSTTVTTTMKTTTPPPPPPKPGGQDSDSTDMGPGISLSSNSS